MNYKIKQGGGSTNRVPMLPIRRGFAPSFVNYKKGCTRLTAASDKVYQLLAHGRWFSPASSTTKTSRHDIAEILMKVALNTKNQSNQPINLAWQNTTPTIWTKQKKQLQEWFWLEIKIIENQWHIGESICTPFKWSIFDLLWHVSNNFQQFLYIGK